VFNPVESSSSITVEQVPGDSLPIRKETLRWLALVKAYTDQSIAWADEGWKNS
jgi:hypothetical protein